MTRPNTLIRVPHPATMTDRVKREKKIKLDKLAELKRTREGGGRSWVQEEATDLYDEVSEEQYKRIVKNRLAKDDFVVDDGVGGYNDNGMDDWDGQNELADSDEDGHRSVRCESPHYSPLTLVHSDEITSKEEAYEGRETSWQTQGSPTSSRTGFDHFISSGQDCGPGISLHGHATRRHEYNKGCPL